MDTSQLIIIAAFVVSGAMFLHKAWRHSKSPPTPERDHLVRSSIYFGIVSLAYAGLNWLLGRDPVLLTIAAVIFLGGVLLALWEWMAGQRAAGREVAYGRLMGLFAILFGVPMVIQLLLM